MPHVISSFWHYWFLRLNRGSQCAGNDCTLVTMPAKWKMDLNVRHFWKKSLKYKTYPVEMVLVCVACNSLPVDQNFEACSGVQSMNRGMEYLSWKRFKIHISTYTIRAGNFHLPFRGDILMKGQSHAHTGDLGQVTDSLSRQQKFFQQSLSSLSQLSKVFRLREILPRLLWKTTLKIEV